MKGRIVMRRPFLIVGALLLLISCPAMASEVKALKVTVLSTMLAEAGFGEWGYAALVEVDGKKILFDTGANPDTVLKNAKALGIDLADVEEAVVSHNHPDHTGGLLTLRETLMTQNSAAISRVHVSANIFVPRLKADGTDGNGLTRKKQPYEATGGQFVFHAEPTEIAPGVWFTGPVPRKYPETNWSNRGLQIQTPAGNVVDNIPEDAALVFETKDGLVVLTGCGHAGIVNITTYARQIGDQQPVFAVIGGFHLFDKSDATVEWTGAQLKRLGVKYLLAGHCTGIEATFRLRRAIGLSRKTAPVSAVGSSFTLGKGIDPGHLAA
jgi:7,8-dihydropterin-6-yl-methyl-4-(beta-D-ribofuranosyl)aminobenzene 5'-phosphate synthase